MSPLYNLTKRSRLGWKGPVYYNYSVNSTLIKSIKSIEIFKKMIS